MSSKPPDAHSIAARLVALFTLASAVLLSCGLGVFYLIVVRHAFEEDNAVLRDKVFALRTTLKNSGPELLRQQVRTSESEMGWHVRLLDEKERMVAESPGMSESLPRNLFPPPETSAWNFTPRNYHHGGSLFSLATTRAEARGQSFFLQVAQDRSADARFSQDFGALLAILIALGIIASAAVGMAVTKRGLRPLNQITAAVARISPTHLDERVAPVGWPGELQPLALAFDEMLNRLEDSFRRLSQFSADLAHELRTPIGNIRGEAEVALTRPRGATEYRAVIESTLAESERLSAIVDNLLFLARAETANGQLERERFDARAAIEKIASYYRTLADERQIRIICAGEGEVVADRLLFDRALGNLLDNSLRFTPTAGTISLTVSAHRDYTEISTADNGSGIPSEHLPRVFDRFYRADSSRSSHGAGLGLALVKSIAQLHGGSATIESEAGRGTKVVLRFPSNTRVAPHEGTAAS